LQVIWCWLKQAVEDAEGLGLAVPINLANDVVDQILTTGRVRRAFLGLEFRDVEPEMAQQFGLPVREGVLVATIGRGTPAAQAGLRSGDSSRGSTIPK
jgi:serine protease DegQ